MRRERTKRQKGLRGRFDFAICRDYRVIVYLGVFANAMAIDATAYGKASDEQLTDNAGNMYLEEKPDRGRT